MPSARCGKLIVAADARRAAALDALRRKAHDNGVTYVVEVDPAFVRAREPNVHAVAALWSPDTGIVEAEALVKALEHLCRDRDVAMVMGSPLVRRERTQRASR